MISPSDEPTPREKAVQEGRIRKGGGQRKEGKKIRSSVFLIVPAKPATGIVFGFLDRAGEAGHWNRLRFS